MVSPELPMLNSRSHAIEAFERPTALDEYDHCIAKHRSVRCAESESVQSVPVLVGQAPSRHDRLRAIESEPRKAWNLSSMRILLNFFCGST